MESETNIHVGNQQGDFEKVIEDCSEGEVNGTAQKTSSGAV
jgi:hypothetical protein